jgi:hypothetical protein
VDERHFFFNFYLVAAKGLHWEGMKLRNTAEGLQTIYPPLL